MKKTLTTLTLAALTGALAWAQAPAGGDADKVVLSANLVFAQQNALDLTHKTSGGYGAEVGYLLSPKDFGADVLIYGGWKKLPAANPSPSRPTYEMVGPHVGFDLVYKPWGSLPITLSTGPSVHVWQVEEQGVANGRRGDQGLKLGWRAGVAYQLSSEWSVGLTYTLTEWRSNTAEGVTARPAFASLGASYRF